MVNYIAEILALIAFILYVASFQFKKKSTVLRLNIAANSFYALEYLMLNAYAGVNNSIFGIARSTIFSLCHRKKVKFPLYGVFIFISLVVIFGIMTYTDIFSIIPVVISIGFFLALYVDNMKLYRTCAAIASCLWIIYNYKVGVLFGVVDAVVELISSCVSIYRFDIRKKKLKQYGYWKFYR